MFFEFRQNNSGGSFDFNAERGISVVVFIEAPDAETANFRAQSIGLYFDGEGDCPCCGNRWCAAWADDGAGAPIYDGRPVEEVEWSEDWSAAGYKWMAADQPEIYVHYADGTVKGYGATA